MILAPMAGTGDFSSAAGKTGSGRIGHSMWRLRMTPNPALNRTGRHVSSTWRASARPAGYLIRVCRAWHVTMSVGVR